MDQLMQPIASRRTRREGGFNLIEIMIALGIFAVGVLALTAFQLQGMRVGNSGRHLTQAAAVAKEYDLPSAYGAKIMSQLAKAKILQSDRGRNGGFKLARAANKITLLEIYEAVHGQLGLNPESALPSALAKPVNAAFDATYAAMRKRLQGVSVGDLMKK